MHNFFVIYTFFLKINHLLIYEFLKTVILQENSSPRFFHSFNYKKHTNILTAEHHYVLLNNILSRRRSYKKRTVIVVYFLELAFSFGSDFVISNSRARFTKTGIGTYEWFVSSLTFRYSRARI